MLFIFYGIILECFLSTFDEAYYIAFLINLPTQWLKPFWAGRTFSSASKSSTQMQLPDRKKKSINASRLSTPLTTQATSASMIKLQ